jgi:hypothetical protein
MLSRRKTRTKKKKTLIEHLCSRVYKQAEGRDMTATTIENNKCNSMACSTYCGMRLEGKDSMDETNTPYVMLISPSPVLCRPAYFFLSFVRLSVKICCSTTLLLAPVLKEYGPHKKASKHVTYSPKAVWQWGNIWS